MNNRKVFIIIIISIIAVIAVLGTYFTYETPKPSNITIKTDMLGRSVSVPAKINKVASISYSTTVAIYMLAPEKLIGWDTRRSEKENIYMLDKYKNLPYIAGGKKDANYETFIKMNPDIVFVGHGRTFEEVNKIQEKLGSIPVVDVENDNSLTNIIPAIKFLGNILGENEKSDSLIKFYDKVLTEVNTTTSKIPQNEKKKVYYARDISGLMTNPPGSAHTQLIEICGGTNVVEAPITKGGVGVSMELILKWNPDVIIVKDPIFYEKIYSDPLWKNINAVKNKEVYLVPNSPFNWFEGPPGVNTIIGIPWMAKVLYPDKFMNLDLKGLTQEFYSEFYHYNLSESEVESLLRSSGLKNL